MRQIRAAAVAVLLALTLVLAADAAAHADAPDTSLPASPVRAYALRLHPGQDLRQALQAFAKARHLQAGFIMAAVGSLREVHLRLADQPTSTPFTGRFEIVSLSGTISADGCHLHAAVSDSQGRTIGGHLVEGCLIYTTAEIVVGDLSALRFRREADPQTTYPELKIERRN